MQIKHLTGPQKFQIFSFQDVQNGHGGTPPQRGQKIIVNQSKPILVIVSIKPFIRQSFWQNYFSREIEWAVFTETAS